MFFVNEDPTPLGPRDECKQGSEDEEKVVLSSFLRRFAYSKSRSMTGTSTCSTDVSSQSSTNDPLGSFDSSGSNEDDFPVLEEVAEETFYDCRSHSSSSALVVDHDDEIATYCHDRSMCVYSDGTPAMAPPGTCVSKVSYDFLEFHDFDEAKATQMWKAMLKWREETEVWKIHARPNVRFEIVKEYYPSCYHGFDREDATVVEWSFPGRMVPKMLVPDAAAIDEVMEHHMWMQEYLFNCLYTDKQTWKEVGREPLAITPGESTTRGIVLIIDLKGAGISLLTANVFTFIKRMIKQSTSYYPAMAKQVILINSPFWVAGVFKTIKPLLPDDLPVEIVSEENSLDIIRKYIDDHQIPAEYGGSSQYALQQHPFELRVIEKAKQAAIFSQEEAVPASAEEGSDVKDSAQSVSSNESDDDDSCCDRGLSEDSSKPSRCAELPFARSLPKSREPTFFKDVGCDDSLELTPNPPASDFSVITANVWNSISKGFRGCGGRQWSHCHQF